MRIPIPKVQRDPTLQLRDGGLDMERIEDMLDAIKDGVTMPPITVVGDDNLLADGFHRVYAFEQSGATEVEAQHVAGDYNDALAIALRANVSGSKQLTKGERNEAIKRLLNAGWTQERIAKATGISRTSIVRVGKILRMRGEVTVPKASAEGRGRPAGTVKEVAVLAADSPAQKLTDSALEHIAKGVPVEQQVEFAEEAAKAGLGERNVRTAIHKAQQGMSPADAVSVSTPGAFLPPMLTVDAVSKLRVRIEDFMSSPFRYKERDLTIAEVIDMASRDVPDSIHAQALANTLERYALVFNAAAEYIRQNSTSNGRVPAVVS